MMEDCPMGFPIRQPDGSVLDFCKVSGSACSCAWVRLKSDEAKRELDRQIEERR